MKLVLIGDAEQPALLRWARQLAPRVRLAAVSSRGFAPGWELLIPDADRLALHLPAGDAVALVRALPRVGAWLGQFDPDWLHAHDVASHGTLAWAARMGWRLRARIACTDAPPGLLVSAASGPGWRWLVRKALRSSALCTTDRQDVAALMRDFGASDVAVFPAGDAFEPQVQRFLSRLREIAT